MRTAAPRAGSASSRAGTTAPFTGTSGPGRKRTAAPFAGPGGGGGWRGTQIECASQPPSLLGPPAAGLSPPGSGSLASPAELVTAARKWRTGPGLPWSDCLSLCLFQDGLLHAPQGRGALAPCLLDSRTLLPLPGLLSRCAPGIRGSGPAPRPRNPEETGPVLPCNLGTPHS